VSISFSTHENQSWTQYPRCGHTYVLYKKINSSFRNSYKCPLKHSQNFVAQAAALSQCKENFKDDAVQIPKPFSKSTSFRFSTNLGVVIVSIVYLLLKVLLENKPRKKGYREREINFLSIQQQFMALQISNNIYDF